MSFPLGWCQARAILDAVGGDFDDDNTWGPGDAPAVSRVMMLHRNDPVMIERGGRALAIIAQGESINYYHIWTTFLK